jgi:hypothetical protein
MKHIIVNLLLLMLSILGHAQTGKNSYKMWIDLDSCWLYRPLRVIGVADGDTLKISKVYEVLLPKEIKCTTNLDAGHNVFLLSNNQCISIETEYYKDILPHFTDTVYIPQWQEVFDIICVHSWCEKPRHYRKICTIAESRNEKRDMRRKDLVLFKDGCRILLFNIKKRDFDIVLGMVQTFKVIGNVSNL